jgi:hypothetical protein
VVDWGAAYNLSDEGFAVLRFDAAPESPVRTRRFLHRTLARWSLLHVLDDAGAVAAELVANAIRHALPPCSSAGTGPGAWIALVHREQSLICAVSDPSPAPPVPVDRDELGEFAENGRGLHIVAGLSDGWGHSLPAATGKTVWARFSVLSC